MPQLAAADYELRSKILSQIAEEKVKAESVAQINPKLGSFNDEVKLGEPVVGALLSAPLPGLEIRKEVRQTAPQIEPTQLVSQGIELTVESIVVPAERFLVTQQEQPKAGNESLFANPSVKSIDVIAAPIGSAEEQPVLEPLGEIRVKQVFEQLLALNSAEELGVEGQEFEKAEIHEVFTEDLVIKLEPDAAEAMEAEPVVYMAELLELAPERVERLQVAEEPPRLEQILERSAEAQPLEETLVELAVYFDQVELEALEPTEAERVEEIKQVLQEIDEYLESPAYKAKAEGKPQITPELTRQLLELLVAVGYKDPGETLVKFVAEYDLYTLVKAIRYLHQLSQASEQQELMVRYGLARPAIGDMPGRWGKLLLSLMMGVVLNNQLRQEEV